LCLALGYLHPDIFLHKISSKQWSEWKAYYSVEPFGHDVGFELVATIASMFANVHRKKGARSIKPNEFYQKTVLQPEKQTQDRMKAAMMQLVMETSKSDKKTTMKKDKVRKNG
jgi:Na+/phosphate symporter